MPEPAPDPKLPTIRRVAMIALGVGLLVMLAKLGAYWLTGSVAVLSDALESIINIVAAGAMLFAIHYSNRPADRSHPYGHGKIEFLVVGLEGWLILFAGATIGYQAIDRLLAGEGPRHLGWGMGLLAIVGVGHAALAWYVFRMGRQLNSDPLLADGKHLLTDVASTLGVILALVAVKLTGWAWLDPVAAIVIAALILFASWRLVWHSINGLMDRSDPADDAAIRAILDEEVEAGRITSYHKVRHRHTGPFHWVDMHLQVDESLSVRQGHEVASRIEQRIEQTLGEGNATAHVEPDSKADPTSPQAEG